MPYVISVFFNPAANDLMMEAAIKGHPGPTEAQHSELLGSGAIAVAVRVQPSSLDNSRSSTPLGSTVESKSASGGYAISVSLCAYSFEAAALSSAPAQKAALGRINVGVCRAAAWQNEKP